MSDRLYRLMTTGGIPPLSYYFARFIARGCGLAPDSMLGCSAALVSLRNLQGDVCVDLAAHAGRPLFDGGADAGAAPRAPDLDQWLEILSEAAWVGAPGSEAPLILDRRHLYLAKYWRYEQRVATDLGARLARCEGLDVPRLAAGLARLFPVAGDAGPDWQRIAAVIAVSRRFAVVSGGPGTGKTTTVVKVLALLLEQDPQLRIALAAPTGKAAARLSDAVRTGKGRVDSDRSVLARIPEDAGTIHRLLGAGFGGVLRHDGDNPLLVDCLVVDEASMIDLPMMARLLEALPERSRLILLGDRDQLASVEAGNVLGDITGHGREIRYSDEQMDFLGQVGALPIGADTVAGEPTPPSDAVGLLRVSYRFSGESGIGALARAVNAGRGEEALDLLEREDLRDISWVDTHRDRPEPTALDWAVERYARYLHAEGVGAALRALEQSRVLAALHRGPFGVDALNTAIASRLQSLGLIEGGDEYHGKPVLITANDYEVGLFNGDVGLLWRDEQQRLRAWFLAGDDGLRGVSVRQLPSHLCAYALTVHKSQGSELDEVMLVLPGTDSPVVTRELIYTGITRARRAVTVQGHRETFVEACRRRVRRTSALAERLGWHSGA